MKDELREYFSSEEEKCMDENIRELLEIMPGEEISFSDLTVAISFAQYWQEQCLMNRAMLARAQKAIKISSSIFRMVGDKVKKSLDDTGIKDNNVVGGKGNED